MKSLEKTKERIKHYSDFFSEVSKRLDEGVVTPEELYSIAEKYDLPDPVIVFQAFIESGVMCAFDVSIPFAPPILTRVLHPHTPHILYWTIQPDDEMAFTLHRSKLLYDEFQSFYAYLKEKEIKPQESKEKDPFDKFLEAGIELLKDLFIKK